jgi:uncharacterized protein YqjF (DUF2071 family)
MKKDPIKNILTHVSHRPYPLPRGKWKYYQEWHEVVFAHWRASSKKINEILPEGLELDLFNGEAWVSLTAFTLKNMRLRITPAFPPLSNFHEINLRTYVKKNGIPGIYFFSLEASKIGSMLMSKLASELPYYRSDILRHKTLYQSQNKQHNFYLHLEYTPHREKIKKDLLDLWLTERYALFHQAGNNILANHIHHQEWPLMNVDISHFKANYQFGHLLLDYAAEKFHYSPGVKVLTWKKQKMD